VIHERLDIAHWKPVFALGRLREEVRGMPPSMQPTAETITGPYDIAVLEQLREESYANQRNVERVPIDVFVWNRGESGRREMTKIGGLPYREAGRRWPFAPSGTPMNFVAQFCFADSHDLVPSLPGDILLVFAEGKRWSWGEVGGWHFKWGDNDGTDSAVAFEWVTMGDFPLVSQQEIPATEWPILPCYGAIHRTWDYPDADSFAYPHIVKYIPMITEATKIGGFPAWIQGEEEIAGEFLCSLGSVFPEITKQYPFINWPEPIEYDTWRNSHPLMLGDVGMMYFFINSYGDIRWSAQGR
jgi:hypothetical protein